MTVSVLISTRNNESTISRCLLSVAGQTRPPEEIIVVNDGSTDGTLSKIQAFAHAHPQTKVVSLDRSRGIAGARNVALNHAAGEACAFLDADAFAAPTWLEQLLAALEHGVGCVGGPDCVPDDDPLVSRCAGYSMHSLVGSGGLRKGGTRLTRYLAAGCNMALRSQAIERVGGFDDTMVPRGEEKDLQLRMRRAGYRTAYAPGAVVWHRRRSTLRTFWRQMIESGIVRVKILRRNPGVTQAAQLAPAVLVGGALLATVAAVVMPPLRPVWLAVVALYAALLLLDGVLAALKLRDVRAVAIVPLTSAGVLLGYGAGTLLELVRPSERRP